ncbi:alpha/beta fold hydrolase [Streptomyces sp. BE133]|uniref:alpha/beta fold hydrolase n=1 Tax=Streptomyces sp. BE133 TaxID=3002523 RepID=UPI002E7656B1|nr:alpha/beta hydrolase [Streptomyces sp. BE133]MEE1805415.1 alpha/beta hydrolase [Streptomyces sp. BE133]
MVLVHGGFADASASWSGVIKRLQRDGYPVVVPANPLRGLSTDAPYLASVLKSVKGPIILARHSYGGAVITNAAAGNPNVKALVYIAAFVTDKGDKLIDLLGKYPGSEIPDAINEVPFTNPDGTTGTHIYLKTDKFRSAFAADPPRSTTNVMQAAQRPASAAHLTEATRAAAWHDIPAWGLVAGTDKAIPPALQRFEYQRAGTYRPMEVPGASHSVMVSHPGTVERLIQAADRGRSTLHASQSGSSGDLPGDHRRVRGAGRHDAQSAQPDQGEDGPGAHVDRRPGSRKCASPTPAQPTSVHRPLVRLMFRRKGQVQRLRVAFP